MFEFYQKCLTKKFYPYSVFFGSRRLPNLLTITCDIILERDIATCEGTFMIFYDFGH